MPLDWGLAYAWAYRTPLFLLAVVPIVAELLASYVLYSERLMRQHMLLVFVVTTFANVWLLGAVVMHCIQQASGEPLALRRIARLAIQHLPKPFFSYLATISLVLLGLTSFVVPGLVFLGFLLWAPAFCIAEVYGAQKSEPQPEENVYDIDDDEGPAQLPRGFFTRRSIFDLGLVRSARLAGSSFGHSIQITLLVLAANVLPGAIVDLLAQGSFAYWAQALKIIFSSLATVLVIGAWAGTFLMLLPLEAKQELGLDKYRDPRRAELGKWAPKLEGQLFPLASLVLLTMLSGWYFYESAKARSEMPPSVQVEVSSSELRGEEVVISLQMIDPDSQFRWFLPDRFQLTYGPPAASPPKEEDKATAQTPGRPLEPLRVELYSAAGEEILPESVSPYDGPLRVILTFRRPGKSESSEFSLRYGGGPELFRSTLW